ncbi:MAG: hypothetical protein COA33_009785 [Fluviicola sp.]|nr:hypothetical protein [Fluviicola sp.]
MLNLKTIKNIVLKSIGAFLVTLFFGATANAASVNPIKVLFIGNSYTHMNDMPKTVEKIARSKNRNVFVKQSAVSSSTFKLHSERAGLFDDINSEQWDFVILQGFSRELGQEFSTIDSVSVPYITKIVNAIYANNACSQVMLYMTWGYENGYEFDDRLNTYPKMAAKVESGYTYISDMFSIPIVPVGNIYREILLSDQKIQLYRDDSQHPTKISSFLIASTFYTSIFNDSLTNSFTGGFEVEELDKVRELIYNYVQNNRSKYKLDLNTFSVAFYTSSLGKHEVDVHSNYPDAQSVFWDFGDGNTSKFAHLRHLYKEPGEYELKLIIQDICGKREYASHVVFVVPRKEEKQGWFKRRKKKKKAKWL